MKNPAHFAGDDPVFGIGDINPQFLFTPSESTERALGTLTWGVGLSFVLPTTTDDSLESEQCSVAPGAVVFLCSSRWNYGFLAQNYWSFAGDSSRDDVNQLVFQQFANYNLADGWSLVSAPTIVVDWEANNLRVTQPVGGGTQKLLNIDRQPINANLHFYCIVLSPTNGSDWYIHAQITFLFQK